MTPDEQKESLERHFSLPPKFHPLLYPYQEKQLLAFVVITTAIVVGFFVYAAISVLQSGGSQ